MSLRPMTNPVMSLVLWPCHQNNVWFDFFDFFLCVGGGGGIAQFRYSNSSVFSIEI